MKVKIRVNQNGSWRPLRIENDKLIDLMCPFEQGKACDSSCPLLDIESQPNQNKCVWKCGSGSEAEIMAEYIVNVDKPTRKFTIHKSTCPYVRMMGHINPENGEKKDFPTIEDAIKYYARGDYKNFELEMCKICFKD